MDLSSTYLGFKLPHPLIVGASPLVDDLGEVKRLLDNGAAAIVMHSLFEEQIRLEQEGNLAAMEPYEESFAEATTYFPKPSEFRLGPDQYLEQIVKVKQAAGKAVPVIASLNGITAAGWLEYAKSVQQAGADAIEVNSYFVATDLKDSGEVIEQRLLDIVRAMRAEVKIPIAVKLSPFYSSVANLAGKLDANGVAGLVLFNRFYQPDIDVEKLEVQSTLKLSDSSELLLRLRWLAILSGKLECSLAASGGVHTPADALKAVMAGADAVQLVSILLKNGPKALKDIREGMVRWLEAHEYQSLAQARGSLALEKCPDPAAFERANYMKILAGWKPL